LFVDDVGNQQQLGYKVLPPLRDKAFARVTVTQMKTDRIQGGMDIYKDSVVKDAKAQKGYRGLLLLSDLKTGKSSPSPCGRARRMPSRTSRAATTKHRSTSSRT